MTDLIIRPEKNELLNHTERLANNEARVKKYMLCSLYLPIKKAMLEGKHSYIYEKEIKSINQPKNLDLLVKMLRDKLPTLHVTIEMSERWNWLRFCNVSVLRIKTEW